MTNLMSIVDAIKVIMKRKLTYFKPIPTENKFDFRLFYHPKSSQLIVFLLFLQLKLEFILYQF
jgi:hypothetical protein